MKNEKKENKLEKSDKENLNNKNKPNKLIIITEKQKEIKNRINIEDQNLDDINSLDLQLSETVNEHNLNLKKKKEENKNPSIENFQNENLNNEKKFLLNTKRYKTNDNFLDDSDFKEENYKDDKILNTKNIECPYIGTIKRHLLDFDFEKVCSISLSNLNVYACLICGKYYQGRGKNTHAYIHSLQEDHHLFINLNDEKIICLPEGYEVLDNSLKDIKLNLMPVYTAKEIEDIDKDKDINSLYSIALDGTEYIPGCIGLNNIKKTDYVNVIIQSLCRVGDLRKYFLSYDDKSTNLVSKFFYKKNFRNLN